MNGYDGSLMSSINAMDPYHEHFNVGMQGGGTGIVFAIYSVGNILGAPAASFISDRFGRRWGMFAGSTIIIVGVILEASASKLGQFMGGRFLIGFGVSVAVTAAPVYLVEMAYPSWRGLFGGLYNVVGYYIGAIGEFQYLQHSTKLMGMQWQIGLRTAPATSTRTGHGVLQQSSKLSLPFSLSRSSGLFQKVHDG